jgi:hypothetical protein
LRAIEADIDPDEPVDDDERKAIAYFLDRVITILEEVEGPNRLLFQKVWQSDNVSLALTRNLAHDVELLGRFVNGLNDILNPEPVPADDTEAPDPMAMPTPADPISTPDPKLQSALGDYMFTRQTNSLGL